MSLCARPCDSLGAARGRALGCLQNSPLAPRASSIHGTRLADLVRSLPVFPLLERSGLIPDEETRTPQIFVGLHQSVRYEKKIVIETKQTAGLRETAHARGKQTGRKKKPRQNT